VFAVFGGIIVMVLKPAREKVLMGCVEGMIIGIIGREGGCTHNGKEGGMLFCEVSDTGGDVQRGRIVFVWVDLRIQRSPTFDGNEASDILVACDVVV